jgi:prepilin-type N-terminal cleavage/methylation domain-containing protein
MRKEAQMLRSSGALVTKPIAPPRPSDAGYSLAEMITVVAIVGVLSLISVPAFMNYQRQNTFKTSASNFTTDLRAARAMAIQQAYDVRAEITTGTAGSREYRFYSSRDGTTWTPLLLKGSDSTVRYLSDKVWFQTLPTPMAFQDIGSNSKPDIVFKPSGAIVYNSGYSSGALNIRTDWPKLRVRNYYINTTSSGQIKMTTSQCSDRIDNDGDGKKDFDTGANKDPQCASIEDNDEAT